MTQATRLPEKTHLGLMLALTFSTGIVDAVGYLGLDRVFTGNMTGNVVILGMALIGGDGLPVVGPVIALVGFVLGAIVSGRALRRVDAGWTIRTTAILLGLALVLAAAAVVLWIGGSDLGSREMWVVTALLGLGMGSQAAAARHLAVKDVTTVVVTSTLTGLASDSIFAGGKGQPWFRRLAAVVLIALGAVVGAACVHAESAIGLLLATVIVAVVAVWGHAATAVHVPAVERG